MKVDYKTVLERLSDIETKGNIAIEMKAAEAAKMFENYAKINRPWTDRTGHARQRLKGWYEKFPDKVKIKIGHGVWYGKYLEFAHLKKYAILFPTVEALTEDVKKMFKNFLR